jgi:tetratricopeptide (TPR) repeat protein
VRNQRIIFVTVAVIAANLLVGVFFMTRSRPSTPVRSEISTPQLAANAIQGRSVFYTAAAREILHRLRPELASEAEEQKFFQATQDPSAWRLLDHRLHFDAIWLCGDANGYRPLLRHLLETRDFVLTYLDHTSVIFARPPATAFNAKALDAMKEKLTGRDRMIFLVGAANKLLAIGMLPLAKGYLDEAILLDGGSADARTQLALYHAQLGEWREALDDCNRALDLDAKFPAALAAKAQILFGSKQFNAALEISQQALEAHPDDPANLFLDAKIAHEAHAFQREIIAMQNLVRLAEKAGAPVSGYRIYLAQAYAADGQAEPAIEQFEKARSAGDLSPEQKRFVEDSIARIRSRVHS